MNDSDKTQRFQHSLDIPRIPAIDRNIDAIIFGQERHRGPYGGSFPADVEPAPATPEAGPAKPVQRELHFPEINAYEPPPKRSLSDAQILAQLTPQFCAATHYQDILADSIRQEAHRKALGEPDQQLAITKGILDRLHPAANYFRELHRFIVDLKPYHDQFLPEVKKALEDIATYSNKNYAMYAALRKQVNQARGYDTK